MEREKEEVVEREEVEGGSGGGEVDVPFDYRSWNNVVQQ